MKTDQKSSLGEAQITPQMLQKTIPNVVSPTGHQKLGKQLLLAHSVKDEMDKVLKEVANKTGAIFSSRIKKGDVAIKKTAQKRLMGRKSYNLDEVNDWYGGRLTVPHSKDIDRVKNAVIKAALAGGFKIDKSQRIEDKDSDYSAWHFDFIKDTAYGEPVKGEIQVMTMRNMARASGSHDQHAMFNEKLPPIQKKLVKTQNKVIDQLPPIKAQQLGDKLVDLHKKNNDNILPPGVVPQTIANAASK